MALNEVPGIPGDYNCLLVLVSWHDLVRCQVITSCDAKSSVCRPQAVAPQCQSAASGRAGSAPGPANTLASLAEFKQTTNDKLKAYFKVTDIV
jgi:hypothetical protein